MALTHNLLLIYEARLEREHGVTNTAEEDRRQARMQEADGSARQAGRALSPLLTRARRATQRSVKFIRWLHRARRKNLAEAGAVPRLAQLYAAL